MNEGILQNEDLPNTETEQALMTGERESKEREKKKREEERRGEENKNKKIERVVYNRQELSKWCLTYKIEEAATDLYSLLKK